MTYKEWLEKRFRPFYGDDDLALASIVNKKQLEGKQSILYKLYLSEQKT